jgi:integrase
MPRKRYQRGTLIKRGTRNPVWVGRFLDDEITPDGSKKRIHRAVVLGTVKDLPTKKLAQRALDQHTAEINSTLYRPKMAITLNEFIGKWEESVLIQYKPSTQASLKSHLRTHIKPAFGAAQLRDITPELAQRFVSKLTVSPKMIRNIIETFRMIWKSAQSWGYVTHEPFKTMVIPKRKQPESRIFTLEEIQKILLHAQEPDKTFYWLASETGCRPGELCGLRWEDLDLEQGFVYVRQSAWQGRIVTPKTKAGERMFAISAQLAAHMKRFKNAESGLIFTYQNGRPWKGEKVVQRKLKPLLKYLNLPHGGLKAFRHGNATLMDRFSAPVKVRQDRLGHTDPRVTLMNYTHAIGEDHRTIAAKLGHVLCPSLPEIERGSVTLNHETSYIQPLTTGSMN